MNRKREKLQAYFAGIFDGEGSVGIYNKGGRRLTLHVTMSEPLGILLLHREYPEATFYTKLPKGAKKYQYVFELQGFKAHDFLKDIKPYTIIKHEQISVALSYLVHRRREKAKAYHHRSDCTHCIWFENTMKALKIPDNGVNSVNLWTEMSREYRSKLAEVKDDIEFMLKRLEGVETKHRALPPVEARSAPEKDIVRIVY